MPHDRFAIPFFYPSKPNGFFYEQEDNPKNSQFCDFSAEFSFPSAGVIKMSPNGPTDFGIGKNIKGFNDSIGLCKMDFKATAKRGYAYKADDVRDMEYKALIKVDGISGDHGVSISVCTGHHATFKGGCCQGFAYMCTTEVTHNPADFRFRKETVHVQYSDSPEKTWTHPKANFKINGLGRYVGICICRYNKPTSGGTSPQDDHVILEYWFNPNPDDDPSDWTMFKRIEDKPGNHWTGSPNKCNGDADQIGVWSGAQNRLKTNSTSGSILFKSVTLREIDPFGTFEEPPPGGGGGGGTGSVNRDIVYAMVGIHTQPSPSNTYLGVIVAGHEIVEAITDPDPFSTLGPDSWFFPATNNEIADTCGAMGGQYADGLWAQGYWSNSDNNCVIPHLNESDLGSSTKAQNPHNGPVLKNAKIYLIYWGSDWKNRIIVPTAAGYTNEIQNKLLNTDKEYFSKLSQYDGIQAPTWGGAVFNTTYPVPTSGVLTESMGKAVIVDTFNRGLLPIPSEVNEDLYMVVIPVDRILSHDNESTANGFHSKMKVVLTPPAASCPTGFHRETPLGPCLPDSITCPAGQHEENGVCVDNTPPPGGDPNPPSEITGVFTLLRDINISRTSPCSGSTGGGGGGGSAGTPFFNEDPDGSNEGNALNDYRVAIYEAARLSTSVMINKLCVGVDVYLKKVGSPTGNATIVQRTSNGTLQKTFGSIDVSTLTTSYVKHSFGPITNTDKKIAKGTRIGVEYSTGTETDYIFVARNKPGFFDAQSSCKITKEGGGSVTAEDYDMCGTFYEL